MAENTPKHLQTKLRNFIQTVWRQTKSLFQGAYRGFISAKAFWSAFAILVILLMISIAVLSIRLSDYVKIDERSVSLRSSMDESLNVFAMEYQNASGEITIKGQDGEKVIAPGAAVEYTLRLRNTDKVALNYHFTPNLNDTSEYRLPVVVRLLDPNDRYVIGSEVAWAPIEEIGNAVCSGTLMQNETAEYIFQWKWPFESGDDEYDSFLGSATVDRDISVQLSFALHAEANTEIAANGGFFSSPSGRVTVVFIIFALLVTAIVLLLLHKIRRIKERDAVQPQIADAPEVVPVAVDFPVAAEAAEPPARTAAKAAELRHAFSGRVAYVNLDTLDSIFQAGERITIGILKSKGLIPQNAKRMKILARSTALLDKPFIVETQGISKNAEIAINKAGGRVMITAPDTEEQTH